MNRIAAKVAKEVFVFFEDDDIDARARQQVAKHYAGRTTAGNAASSRRLFHDRAVRA